MKDQPSAPCRAKGQRQRTNRPSADYFDETRQFLAGIEVYPFAGRVQISQAPIFFALNPDQFLDNWNRLADWAAFRK
jgi:hypothetical protein